MGFLADKKILITGLLSKHSIAYGIAKACHREGAQLAFTYQSERFEDRIKKFAAEFGSDITIPLDAVSYTHLDVYKRQLADGILAGMAERRIADVVGQTGGGDDGAEIARFDIAQAMPGDDLAADDSTQRAADATGLQAVRQAGADVIALGKRENLRLVLQPAKSRGEDNAVIVLLKSRALGGTRCLAGTETFTRQQFFPDFSFAHLLRIIRCSGLRVYPASRAARM